ncbi:uncharacterized protein LOC129293116 [Prosopis cineraria]|uniref:uncharacterized protein LOC129293116 n=1 Tax=Prosopis cineraria TaxID=364024 RepID=UPI00240FC759|nr:uncharacterized protein LOC129293116 [Prosopis cineraria]
MADQPVPPKKTKGQQKVEIKMVEDAKRRSVTFTKRKAGLFKKADQLCTLTGAEVALMVFSPGGKPYTFGSPDVNTVIQRYKSQVRPSPRMEQLQAELNEILEQLAYEDKRAEELKENKKQLLEQTWMAAPMDTLSRAQKQCMQERLVQLNKVLSQLPPGLLNLHGLLAAPPQNSASEFQSSSLTALLTQTPELQGSSVLSRGTSTAPVTGSQNFTGNMMITPSGNFYTGESSSAVPAGTQNHVFNMILNGHDNFREGESSSMVPAESHNNMFEENGMLNSYGNFNPDEPSAPLPAESQNHMFDENMMLNVDDYLGESSSMVPAETRHHMLEDNMMMPGDSNDNLYIDESSSMVPMFEDNMILNSQEDFYTGGSSSMASEAQIIMFGDNMMQAANDNFLTSGSLLTADMTGHQNQFYDENIMIPQHDNFNARGSSIAVPPADGNQIFDENIMVPPHDDNYYICESSLVPTTYESLDFDENMRWLLDDQFYGSSSSMALPEQGQMFDGNVIPPPPPPPYDGYGAGPSGFN